MTARKKTCISALAIFILVLAACQNAEPQAAATPTHSPAPSAAATIPASPTATETPTGVPTVTSLPPATDTPTASSTPDGDYTNTTLGFSLTLPNGWIVETSDDGQVTFTDPTGAVSLTVYELTTGEKIPMREAVRRMAVSIPDAVIAYGDPFPMKMGQDVTLQEIDSSLTSGDSATIMRLLMGEVNSRTYIIYSLIPRDLVSEQDPIVGQILKSIVFLSP